MLYKQTENTVCFIFSKRTLPFNLFFSLRQSFLTLLLLHVHTREYNNCQKDFGKYTERTAII